jgi:hypothetical protein
MRRLGKEAKAAAVFDLVDASASRRRYRRDGVLVK